MRVKFWGTRGSTPTPGRGTEKYGGNTACVEVSQRGSTIILDGGTGIRELGLEMSAKAPCEAIILFSHCHWDHIQGLPHFKPFFHRGFVFRIVAPPLLNKRIRAILGKQMEADVFPVDFAELRSEIRFEELPPEGMKAGPFMIRAFHLNHPGGSAGYRIESKGRSLVYASDHEVETGRSGLDRNFIREIRGTHLYIADGQYLEKEYSERRGWGHSTIEQVLRHATAARVGRLAITHHDPTRDDHALLRVEHDIRKHTPGLELFFAREGLAVEV